MPMIEPTMEELDLIEKEYQQAEDVLYRLIDRQSLPRTDVGCPQQRADAIYLEMLRYQPDESLEVQQWLHACAEVLEEDNDLFDLLSGLLPEFFNIAQLSEEELLED